MSWTFEQVLLRALSLALAIVFQKHYGGVFTNVLQAIHNYLIAKTDKVVL